MITVIMMTTTMMMMMMIIIIIIIMNIIFSTIIKWARVAQWLDPRLRRTFFQA